MMINPVLNVFCVVVIAAVVCEMEFDLFIRDIIGASCLS